MAQLSTRQRLLYSLPTAMAVLLLLVAELKGAAGEGLAIAAFSALGQWIILPLIGQRKAPFGIILDGFLLYGGLIIGGAIFGTLLLAPGWGTILGARAAAVLPFASVVHLAGILLAFSASIFLVRR